MRGTNRLELLQHADNEEPIGINEDNEDNVINVFNKISTRKLIGPDKMNTKLLKNCLTLITIYLNYHLQLSKCHRFEDR